MGSGNWRVRLLLIGWLKGLLLLRRFNWWYILILLCFSFFTFWAFIAWTGWILYCIVILKWEEFDLQVCLNYSAETRKGAHFMFYAIHRTCISSSMIIQAAISFISCFLLLGFLIYLTEHFVLLIVY